MAEHAKPEKKHNENLDLDAALDEALLGTFPASDPPAQTNPSQGTRVDSALLGGDAEQETNRRTAHR